MKNNEINPYVDEDIITSADIIKEQDRIIRQQQYLKTLGRTALHNDKTKPK